MKSIAIVASVGTIAATSSVSDWVNKINGPADLEQFELLQTGASWALNANKIYDADGDGVEDNVHMTSSMLDKFYFPTSFNTAEDIYNTRNGELPGHLQKEFYDAQAEPTNTHDLVKAPWKKW